MGPRSTQDKDSSKKCKKVVNKNEEAQNPILSCDATKSPEKIEEIVVAGGVEEATLDPLLAFERNNILEIEKLELQCSKTVNLSKKLPKKAFN